MYEGEKLRVHIAALGDVGATTLMGLKLLGGDVIETIGIIDLDENRMKRYEAECNQICYPWSTWAIMAMFLISCILYL